MNMTVVLRMIIMTIEKKGMHPPINSHTVPLFSGETCAKGSNVLVIRYIGSVNFMKNASMKFCVFWIKIERITLPITSHMKSASV